MKRVLRSGEPAAEIVAYANNHDSDLIIMPTHGYGVFRRRLLGSITAKVLHDSDCDLLVIGRGGNVASGRLRLITYGIIRESPCPVVSV